MEARLKRHALERRANCLASDPDVPAGNDTVRSGPAPRNLMVPMTEPSPDAARTAGAIETIKREKLAGYEAPGGIGVEADKFCIGNETLARD
jgi:hypothetical protein